MSREDHSFPEAIAMSIDLIQQQIIEELSTSEGNLDKVLLYIMAMGKRLPVMPFDFKRDDNLIKGCNSKVWLAPRQMGGQIFFYADSDTLISRGLAGLLLRVCNGHLPEAILGAEIFFIRENKLERFIGTKRSAGLQAMVDQIRFYARQQRAQHATVMSHLQGLCQ